MQPVVPAPARHGRTWLAALAGFALAAVIFVVLVVTGVLRSDDDPAAPSTAPISMPRTVGNFSWLQSEEKKVSKGKDIGRGLANERLTTVRTTAALSAAHDGAGAGVQAYADASMVHVYTVLAVRDATPPPVLGVDNAKLLGMAEPTHRIERVGSSYCEVDVVRPTPYGHKPAPDSEMVTSCQRSSGSLTVIVRSGNSHDPREVVAFVDRMWDAIS